ncbi:MAG: ATP-binding protein [Rhodocyclaceae bacterium]|nr:ATP-binding protein [Rhodocyclaceae bacterium]
MGKIAQQLQRMRIGIRAKLILLFVVIKVIPLVLLAILAWKGVSHLADRVTERSDKYAENMRQTVGGLTEVMIRESTRALDVKSRDALERLTTDTALAVADFLYARDRDALLAAGLPANEAAYREFLANRMGRLVDPGRWELAADGKSWVPAQAPEQKEDGVTPENAENRQDFHYRPPERFGKLVERPLFHEITFVGLDGREKVKVAATKLLPKALRDVSRRENTWCKAETYFSELKKLKPGEIYVSDVIGPYVRSRVLGPVTPEKAQKLGIPYEPNKEAYAGRENPHGQRFQGIVRWATPVAKDGKVVGYVTLALDHSHIMRFTDTVMPTEARYTPISDATNGNYAFIWDYRDRSIAHPRHHSIVGFNPQTGEYETPWMDGGLYKQWQDSGKPLRPFLAGVPEFDHQTREKKPAKELGKAGLLGLDCRYLNFAPQCQGWHNLTEKGGSGSFVILWTGVWKLTTAATIPYYTGKYGKTARGFGYVTIGANVDEFHKAATQTKALMDEKVKAHSAQMKVAEAETRKMISDSLGSMAFNLVSSTGAMVLLVILVAVWLAGLLTKRVTHLTHGLAQIEAGDLSHRIEKSSDDEMGALAQAINHMADSVQESFQKLEDAKFQAESANRMKSGFLSNVSHELRTPLNGILGFAELLESDLTDPEQRGYAQAIHSSGSHLLELVNEVLDLAKIEAGRLELSKVDTDLGKLLAETAAGHRAAAEQKGLVLEEKHAPDLPERLVCDPLRLRQILNNLLHNAVKFTASGQVGFAVTKEDNPDGAYLRFSVSDTGPGIPEEQQALIFEKFNQAEKFMQREHGGAGLGLSLVRQLVTLMGGRLGLESTVGAGSTFYVLLPLDR